MRGLAGRRGILRKAWEYGWLRREPTSPVEIKILLGIVERSLADSRVDAVSTDLKFCYCFQCGALRRDSCAPRDGSSCGPPSWSPREAARFQDKIDAEILRDSLLLPNIQKIAGSTVRRIHFRSPPETVEQVPLPEFKDAPVVKRLIRKSKPKIQRRGKTVPQKAHCVNLCVNNF